MSIRFLVQSIIDIESYNINNKIPKGIATRSFLIRVGKSTYIGMPFVQNLLELETF